ncbi:MAG TPA: flagellar hook-length control protein FliK [Nitrospirae bacterium]|nr:flagellar hook-length control protein FliK [Nitrospirota bacterium]HDZ01825.1 flagellar hook-length control protein FliK [Nitrospirota bacterium]
MPLALMSGMNVIAQKMAEIGSSRQLNAKPDFNPGGKVYGDKFAFSSLMNNIKSDTPGFSGIPRRKGYNGNGRIERRPDRQTGIYGREYNRRSDEIKGRPEQPDGNKEINGTGYRRGSEQKDEFREIDNRDAGHKVEAERDAGKPEAASGEKRAEENSSGTRDVSNGGSDESPLNENEATISGEAGGEGNTDTILSGLLNTLAEESTDNVLNGNLKASGKPGSGEGAGDDPKTVALLNGILAKSVNSNISPENDSENAESLNSALNGPGKVIKRGALLSETPDESADKKGSVDLESLINARAKPQNTDRDDSEAASRELSEQSGKNTDLKKDHAGNIKSTEDAVKAELREGNSSVKELNSKAVSEFMGNLNREGGLKNPENNDAVPVRVETGNNNSGLPNNSGVAFEGGKVSASLETGNVSRPAAFNEIVDKIVYVAKGDNKLGVTIEHKDLGKLNISLSLEKGMVNVHINTADKAAREFVENNIQQIVDSLSKNGVSVGGFSVGLKNYKNSEGNADGNGKGNNSRVGGRGGKRYFKEANNISLNNGMVSIFA